MKISNDILYVGVKDHDIDLFEGQYRVPHGIRYNSYVVLDEAIAVVDTVDARFGEEWLSNIESVLQGRKPTYLLVQHMEPDHSANINRFTQAYPEATVVATAKAFAMMKAFYGEEFESRRLVVKEGDTLSLGTHTLTFVTAPMVHWPEVMVTYDSTDKVLFSADAFGTFGDGDEPWADEARRYYIGIVGKYGAQVQALLKKAAALEIATICPLHGPVLKEDLEQVLALYNAWSSYEPEENGVVIAYTSIYGNTAAAAKELAAKLNRKTVLYDLARCDKHQAIADAFRYDTLVVATTTYNNDIFPFMRTFLHGLAERNYQRRTVALIENGSWAPTAAKVMRGLLEPCKDLHIVEPTVTIRSALDDAAREQLTVLAEVLSEK